MTMAEGFAGSSSRLDAVSRDQRRDILRGCGIAHENMSRIEALPQPALEESPAHLPRSHQQQRAGEAEAHAWPCVSSMVAASDCSADFPAHSTNWKD